MSDFQLGQRVTYSEHLRRREAGTGEFGLRPDRLWSSNAGHFSGEGWEEHRWPGGEGVIVGKRTLSNGTANWLGDGGTEYVPTWHFTAYLIAHNLHRKPVYVLPEHIEPVIESETTA
ncbi:hypothetical protein [Arthrobacter sp. Z1-15]